MYEEFLHKSVSDWTDKLFTSTLTGAAGVLAIFLILLVVLLYKYKQVSSVLSDMNIRYELKDKMRTFCFTSLAYYLSLCFRNPGMRFVGGL